MLNWPDCFLTKALEGNIFVVDTTPLDNNYNLKISIPAVRRRDVVVVVVGGGGGGGATAGKRVGVGHRRRRLRRGGWVIGEGCEIIPVAVHDPEAEIYEL